MRRLLSAAFLVVVLLLQPSLGLADAHSGPSIVSGAFSRSPYPIPALDTPDRAAALHSIAERWPAQPADSESLPEAGLPAAAGDLIGSNFPIANFPDVVTGQEQIMNPELAHDTGRDEYLVVWQAFVRASGNNIYARKLTGSGALPGPIFGVCESAGDQLAPTVAYDASNDQYWVTWTDASSGQFQIRARRVSPAGVLLGSEIAVSAPDAPQFAASVACGGGRCAITWVAQTSDSVSFILVKGYDSAGLAFTPVLLLSPDNGVATEPDVCYNAEDQHFLVVWAEYRTGTYWDIRGYRLTKELQSAGGNFSICAASGNQRVPRPAYNPLADQYLVVWQDGRSGSTWDIYGQRLGRNGAANGSALAVFTGAYHDLNPAVAAQANDSSFLAAYEYDISGAGQYQVYARRVASNGALGSNFAVRQSHNTRGQPAIANRNGSSDFMLVWNDNFAGTQPDVMAQRARSDGTLQGTLIVPCAGRKGQESPALAYDADHDVYLVAWQDYRSGSNYNIYARFVSPAGDLLSSEVVVSGAGLLNADPCVLHLPGSDEYLVVWQEIHSAGTGYDIYAQRISTTGSKLGSAVFVSNGTNAINEGLARVAYGETAGEYLVVWHAFTNGSWNIYAQRLSRAGALLGSNYLLSNSNADEHVPHVVYDRLGDQYIVVWQDFRTAGRVDIYGQRLYGSGGLNSTNYSISLAPGNKGRCDLAMNEQDHQFLLVWGDTRSGYSIYGLRLDSTGWAYGSDFLVSDGTAYAIAPALAYDRVRNEYMVAWWELYESTDYDIYAGQVSASFSPQSRFAVATAPEVQSQVQIAQNTDTGEFLLVWQDFRNGSYDIYGQRCTGGAAQPPTPTMTPTQSATPTPTRTSSPTPTATPTGTAPASATPTASATATRTASPSATPTTTATATQTAEPTHTATSTRTLTPTITPTATPCRDRYEPDDTPAQASWLALNDLPQWHISEPSGDVDYVRFNAKAGWVYWLRTFGLTGPGNDTLLRLYGTDGHTLLAENDDDPLDAPASRIEWACPSTGTYFASVQQVFDNVHGCDVAYSLELAGGLNTPTPTAPYRPRLYLPVVVRSYTLSQ